MEELQATVYRLLGAMNRGLITTQEAYDYLAEMEEKIRLAEEIVLDREASRCYNRFINREEN